jgi:hypothetical protein
MEKVESPTALRVKSSFSIENILSRPDAASSESQKKLLRQNPFQNNHVLFYSNPVSPSESSSFVKCEERIKTSEEDHEEDRDTNSDADDDGTSSVHSESRAELRLARKKVSKMESRRD